MPARPPPLMSLARERHRFTFRHDLRRWRQLIDPLWLAALNAGSPVPAAPAAGWRLFEIGCGDGPLFAHSHIPGAAYLDPSQFEHPPR